METTASAVSRAVFDTATTEGNEQKIYTLIKKDWKVTRISQPSMSEDAIQCRRLLLFLDIGKFVSVGLSTSMPPNTKLHMDVSIQLVLLHAAEYVTFQFSSMSCHESWIHHFDPETDFHQCFRGHTVSIALITEAV